MFSTEAEVADHGGVPLPRAAPPEPCHSGDMDPAHLRIVVPVADLHADPDAESELVTQALLGEPVIVLDDAGDWVRVACTEQPSSLDERGYPGWLRAEQVAASIDPDPDPDPRRPAAPASAEEFVAAAQAFGGVPYRWGGVTREGIDCSGLVHMALREVGVRIPRDASDQQLALPSVDLDDARPGDLYFFAPEGSVARHVGVVTGPGVMVHASESDALVIEQELDETRRGTLLGVGRVFP